MMKPIGLLAASASVLVLSACGGGGGDAGGPSGAVALNSRDDALRELAMSSQVLFLLEDFTGDVDPGGGGGTAPAVAPKSLDGQRSCDAGGSSVLQTGSGMHSYARFGRSVETPYEQVTDTQCKIVYNNGALLVTYDGRTETGRSGTLSDGSQLVYAIVGSGSDPYEERHEDRDGSNTTTRTVTELLSGSSEARIGSSSTDIRSVARYEYSDDRSKYTARVSIGSAEQPFTIVNANGQKFSGTYGYRSSECDGGSVTVSTPQELLRNDQGRLSGGQLKFSSGSKSATFTFNNDGGATLDLNGQTLSLTPAEVQTAVDDEPC